MSLLKFDNKIFSSADDKTNDSSGEEDSDEEDVGPSDSVSNSADLRDHTETLLVSLAGAWPGLGQSHSPPVQCQEQPGHCVTWYDVTVWPGMTWLCDLVWRDCVIQTSPHFLLPPVYWCGKSNTNNNFPLRCVDLLLKENSTPLCSFTNSVLCQDKRSSFYDESRGRI